MLNLQHFFRIKNHSLAFIHSVVETQSNSATCSKVTNWSACPRDWIAKYETYEGGKCLHFSFRATTTASVLKTPRPFTTPNSRTFWWVPPGRNLKWVSNSLAFSVNPIRKSGSFASNNIQWISEQFQRAIYHSAIIIISNHFLAWLSHFGSSCRRLSLSGLL